MRTQDARAIRQLETDARERLPVEPMPIDVVDAVADLQPLLDRVRRGEWRVTIDGPQSPRERDAAALLTVRLMDLAEVLEARR